MRPLVRTAVAAISFSLIGLLPAIPAPAASAPASARYDVQAGNPLLPFARAAGERVVLADKVAAAKYGTPAPIDDPVREKAVLDRVAGISLEWGIDPEASVRIFRDQIEANKLVQREWYRRWDVGQVRPPEERPDLAELRTLIDQLNAVLLAEIRRTVDDRSRPSCVTKQTRAYATVVGEQRLDGLHSMALARALPSLCAMLR
ncbi:gamma subclass chorismate mutase AroQ [Kribbella deserti]|uniref:chorismate mutase n=1 Tax=Kribbella deserti TaxID=1926257 RepID=A0ABV6QJV1_9ACTN